MTQKMFLEYVLNGSQTSNYVEFCKLASMHIYTARRCRVGVTRALDSRDAHLNMSSAETRYQFVTNSRNTVLRMSRKILLNP
ncbi:hypothetical protein Cylst_0801 [Cylindrospermum stagnale PCC 7417]|uniref:Uncharacterized protein n=1 Tax=Cylindrospermum stagnale PCC 7417 TaxID=56107 RepID=K9WSG0_9NOST|nr:hypothetical protein Cylst_0801 [Cylindrospermum stagnale PCC 7417]